MSKHKRAALLSLGGFALEGGAAIALGFCYLLHRTPFIGVVATLLVLSGCLFSLGIIAFLYASLALGGDSTEKPGSHSAAI
jgi:hypothetical protein